jgi:hypothetical protein
MEQRLAEDSRAEEDPGRRLPKDAWHKSMQFGEKHPMKEAKLRFEIPEARRAEGAKDHRSVGGHTSTDRELRVRNNPEESIE